MSHLNDTKAYAQHLAATRRRIGTSLGVASGHLVEARPMVARYAGQCSCCGQPFAVGTRVLAVKNQGAWTMAHEDFDACRATLAAAVERARAETAAMSPAQRAAAERPWSPEQWENE